MKLPPELEILLPSTENEENEQDGSGNGGQLPSFASLCESFSRRATPLTFCKNETSIPHRDSGDRVSATRSIRHAILKPLELH